MREMVIYHNVFIYLSMYMLFYEALIIIIAGPSGRAVYGRSPAGIVGSSPAGGMDVCLC